MTKVLSSSTGSPRKARQVWIAFSVGVFVFFITANIHLVYVAVASQPDCVPHYKDIDAIDGTFRAAKPGC